MNLKESRNIWGQTGAGLNSIKQMNQKQNKGEYILRIDEKKLRLKAEWKQLRAKSENRGNQRQ